MEEREKALLDAVFGNGPNPHRWKMPSDQVIREWIESTEGTIAALQAWLANLKLWAHLGSEDRPGEFTAAYRALCEVVGDGWADQNPAGGGIDRLAEVITGRAP